MILPATRLLLLVFGALTFLAFLALFVMAGHTDRYFAWTIVPPVTAAFFGAAYAAGCAGVLLGLRSGRWAGIRVPYLSVHGSDPGVAYVEWLLARVANTRVEVWPDHGHYPHLVDPARFVERIDQFDGGL